MRKINIAIVALTLLLAFLSYTMIEVKAVADPTTYGSPMGRSWDGVNLTRRKI